MTVKDLIERLQEFPPGAVVWDFNSGVPTPVSEVEQYDKNPDKVMIW